MVPGAARRTGGCDDEQLECTVLRIPASCVLAPSPAQPLQLCAVLCQCGYG